MKGQPANEDVADWPAVRLESWPHWDLCTFGLTCEVFRRCCQLSDAMMLLLRIVSFIYMFDHKHYANIRLASRQLIRQSEPRINRATS